MTRSFLCSLCGAPISRKSGYTVVRDWHERAEGTLILKRTIFFCARCDAAGAVQKWARENPNTMGATS